MSPALPARPRPRSRPRTLRTRLVLSTGMLVAVVCAVIGTVTAIVLRSYLYGQLDGQLGEVVRRAAAPRPPDLRRGGPLSFVQGGGQPIGTVGALTGDDGRVTDSAVSTSPRTWHGDGDPLREPLTAAQSDALARLPRDGRPHDVGLPGRGDYRARSVTAPDGTTYLVGIPTTSVQETLDTLIVVEVCVTAAGLVAAGIAAAATVRLALGPLRRVAATATRVSELPLHQGEVALHERVPEAEADPRTEVGQVGAALNRMLGHVGSALTVRQESETRVRQFVADASHELRTPLASILGYAELTRRTGAGAGTGSGDGGEAIGPRTRHALGRIESEARRMTGLVEDLLLLARLDTGRRPQAFADLDLSPLVVDAVSDARAAGPGHVWRMDLPAEPVAVRGDAARLHQVLVNLLANARTHTPAGTTVTARAASREGWAVVSVEDDGPGIPAELLPHVFERFARGDASRSRAAGGSGLGLAIVRAVVAAHGGEVGVQSAAGRTVFTVRLPVRHRRVAPPGLSAVAAGEIPLTRPFP
ncbi:HAMP domain-containing protein [Streptomyces klenkii]|uniref:histidine kinase n=2 Tax=Streptomyces klenkii TaxID=1420899 RepID=A0A3B0BLH8_9ACTN|nr:HAMP domain-containing sensor histidine kinase [Streptomyces klenkii]RKN74533.1 HAMP domain-containing protein [Streptomyces klenkii]